MITEEMVRAALDAPDEEFRQFNDDVLASLCMSKDFLAQVLVCATDIARLRHIAISALLANGLQRKEFACLKPGEPCYDEVLNLIHSAAFMVHFGYRLHSLEMMEELK